jgi:hypothetical protein
MPKPGLNHFKTAVSGKKLLILASERFIRRKSLSLADFDAV